MKPQKYYLIIPFLSLLSNIVICIFLLSQTGGAKADRLPFLLTICIFISLISLALILLMIRLIYSAPIRKLKENIKNYSVNPPEDYSQRKDDIGELYNSITDLKKQLELEREKQNRIIASISHDIKTPLTSVMGYTERLKNGLNLPPERHEKYLDTIYQKSREIRDIVLEFDDYLSCNIKANAHMEIIPTETMLSTITREIKSEISGEDAEIVLRDHTTPQDCVFADIKKMHRVFSNIISNSIKHSGAEHLSIQVDVVKNNELIEFSIADNGTGVREEDVARVFEPMYTTDQSRSIAGLGLAICSEIITAHGGTIRAESAPGHGFTVKFTLKCVTLQAE